jgi:hypothetical protein
LGAVWVAQRIYTTANEREYAANGMPKCASSAARRTYRKHGRTARPGESWACRSSSSKTPKLYLRPPINTNAGLVTLTNAQKYYPLSYEFKKDSGDQYLIEVRVEGL